MSAIYLIGFIQSLFVSSLLLFKKNKVLSDVILLLFILVLGFFLFFTYADETGLLAQSPLLFLLDILYWTLIGPLLYIYIDLMTKGEAKLKPIYIVHLLPTIIVLSGFISFFFQNEVKDFFSYNPGTRLYKLAVYVWYYNSPLYYVLCLIPLYRHKQKIKEYYATTKDVDLNWLFYLVHGFAVFLLMGISSGLIGSLLNVRLPSVFQYNWLMMIIYIFGMGYFGYRQKGLFAVDGLNETNLKAEFSVQEQQLKVHKKSTIDDEEAAELECNLRRFMEEDKLYLDCELDLRELSLKLDTTQHKLSQLINDHMNTNFYELINKYRVEEVKKALIDPANRNLKIMSVAYDSGFNSKSSFYNIFKKYTGQNPSAYKTQFSS